MFILTDDSDALAQLLDEVGATLRMGRLAHVGDEGIEVVWRDGVHARLVQPNMLCIGFIALTAEAPLAETLRDWWSERCGVDLEICVAPRDVPEARRRATLWSWISKQILAFAEIVHQENR